jgi:hypothetical protein
MRQFENEIEVFKALKKSLKGNYQFIHNAPIVNLFPKMLASGRISADFLAVATA